MPNFDKNKKGFWHGFCHIFAASSYSLQGLVAGFRLSLAYKQECFVFLALVGLLFICDKPALTWFCSLGLWSLVLILELINTALEEGLDLITKDFSPAIKNAKDMASAAVFIAVIFNAFAQLYIFFPELSSLFS